MELLLLNFRLPRERRGDFRAQFAANRIGADRLGELLAPPWPRDVRGGHGRAARLRRAEDPRRARGDPRRRLRFEDCMDDDGAGGPPGADPRHASPSTASSIALDFAGTGRRCPATSTSSISPWSPPCTTRSRRCSIPSIPANGGFYRAIRVDGARRARSSTRSRPRRWPGGRRPASASPTSIFGALAPALPERVDRRHQRRQLRVGVQRHRSDAPASTTSIWRRSAAAPARARPRTGSTACRSTSPTRRTCRWSAWRWSIRSWSRSTRSSRTPAARAATAAGSGCVARSACCAAARRRSSARSTAQRVAPWGLFGGGPGGRGALRARTPARRRRALLGSKIAGLRLRRGDAVTIVTPGAGGYGAPAERDPGRRARDVRDGNVSAQ